MNQKLIRPVIVAGGVLLLAAGSLQGHQLGWVARWKSAGTRPAKAAARSVPVTAPRLEISGGANGVYCVPQTENGLGVHNLGFIPAGLRVTVSVESFSDGFDPVAAVVLAVLGQNAGNNVRTTTFYDDDSGGDLDAKVEFSATQSGTYVLFVNDQSDSNAGCYRYQMTSR